MENKIANINSNSEEIYSSIRSSVINAQHRVYSAVNSAMVIAYWEIGEQIYKACGENERAEYGKNLLKYLSDKLTAEFGKGFSVQGLRNMRQFYCTYPIRSTLCSELSWSHYRVLMRVSDKTVRDFYTEECAKSMWSVRQLERQINTMYYQRLLASQDKIAVAAEIESSEPKPEYEKAIKDPYVMEFLQIKPDTHVYETDIEQALIDHLQQFLLELGRGFSFVSRQKRFTLNGQDFFIDLVFYNYILKCFVLIDLKTDKLTHQDLGQMQMYVNYYTRELCANSYMDRYKTKDGKIHESVRRYRYLCAGAAMNRNECDGQTVYTAQKVDSVVIQVLHECFKKIKVTPKDAAIEKRYKAQITELKREIKKLEKENESLKRKLRELSAEIANALLGDSKFTEDALALAITTTKDKIVDRTALIEEKKNHLDNKEAEMVKLDYYYEQFVSWADEFDNASAERKRMILCTLFKRITVGKDYRIEVLLDNSYEQFIA